jgi:hypothetical protein
LNRNYPDFQDGPHPDGHSWQPETIVMMDFADDHNFVLSVNFHGGAEVVNYPWDTWSILHADDDWYIDLSRDYADLAQANSPPGYLDGFDNGITNGYDWYEVDGGRQDFMNYYHGCREVTIELSNTKLPPGGLLPSYWNYNRDALLDYLKKALFGVQGTVTEVGSGTPLHAHIAVLGHDQDSSGVWTDPLHGNYVRMLAPGTYDLEFSADGYASETVYGVTVVDDAKTTLNVELGTTVCTCPYQGDADEDEFVTALDLGSMIDILYAGAPDLQDPDCPTKRFDLDCDSFTTALDLADLIDFLFAGGAAFCNPCAP